MVTIPDVDWHVIQAALTAPDNAHIVGEGGQAIVYMCRELKLPPRGIPVPVAIKVYKEDAQFPGLVAFKAEV